MPPATDRLYFEDAYIRGFEARVVARELRGNVQLIALDRTAFYPEGGGQPPDHGLLDGVPVLDVQAESDVIWHTVERGVARDTIHGEIDWARRFDHMQQHHGQHLLSAAFEELHALPTLAFHLGREYASIDLPGLVTWEAVVAAERRANDVIWEDRPVLARFVPAAELAALPLRKPPVVEGPVRVVSVEGFDYSACGGTHPRSTGAVGLLHIRKAERRGSETRIEFLCGGRALADHRWKSDLIVRLSGDLTVGPAELPDALARLRDGEAASRKRLTAVLDRLVELEARDLLTAAGGPGRVVRVLTDAPPGGDGRRLAAAIAAIGGAAVIGVRGGRAQLVLARPEGLTLNCAALLREILGIVGGRGGGQPGVAQGGLADAARLEEAVALAFNRLSEAP